MKEIKLPFEQVTVFSIHWSYLMFVIGTTGIARTKKSVLYKMRNSICFTFSGVFLVFGDVFNSFFSCKFWDSENLPVSSIRYTRGGGQISQDSIFTFPKVTESSLNLRLALRQKKTQLRIKDLLSYISLLMIITKGNNDLLRFENQLRHLLPPVDAHLHTIIHLIYVVS